MAVSVPVRRAAALTGVSRASASYRPRSATGAAGESVRPVPVNKLTADERQQVLGVLDSDRFIDLALLQIYGRLLDSGVFVGYHQTRWAGERPLLRRVRDDRYLFLLHRWRECPSPRIGPTRARDDGASIRSSRHTSRRARRSGHVDDIKNRCHVAR